MEVSWLLFKFPIGTYFHIIRYHVFPATDAVSLYNFIIIYVLYMLYIIYINKKNQRIWSGEREREREREGKKKK